MEMTELGLYVYGVLGEDAPAAAPELPGVDDAHAVECLHDGDLCALVSRVSLDQFEEQPLREHLADMAWVEHTARRHQQVLDSVLHRCTPLPMRLCTVYADEQGLRQMLDARRQEISAALSELSGKLEWGVQAFAGRRPGSPSSQAARAGGAVATGTAYLQSKLAARQAGEAEQAEIEAACDHVHVELGAIALAGRLGTPQRPEASGREAPMLLNGFYLVSNEQRERFRGRVEQLGGEVADRGIELRLTGPWPPYNFVPAGAGEAR